MLVFFYPKDDTPGCTKEACSLRDNFTEIKKLNANVVGISIDSSDSHKEFKEKYKDSGNWKHEMSQALLNELGQDGWELASQNSANEIYLKRQI